MPVTLPHRAEMIFSTYDPNYIPGYGGFVPKLRSQIGETYGNATLRLLTYEPGQPKSSRLTLTQTQQGWDVYASRHLLNRTYGQTDMSTYTGQVHDMNIKNGYFYPRTGKYYYALRHYTYDNNPRTTAAIQTIDEVKAILSDQASGASARLRNMPKVSASSDSTPWTSARHKTPPKLLREPDTPHGASHKSDDVAKIYQESDSPSKIFQESSGTQKFMQPGTALRPISTANPQKTKSLKSGIIMEMSKTSGKMEDYVQNRQGRVIYKLESGLMPNYSGYVPGEKFVYGKRWSVNTANALGVGQHKPFQRTSLF